MNWPLAAMENQREVIMDTAFHRDWKSKRKRQRQVHVTSIVVTEVILPHFRVRPFCVVVSSSPWNWRSRVRISGLELTRHSALHYSLSMLSIRALSSKYIQWRIQDFLAGRRAQRERQAIIQNIFMKTGWKRKKLGRGVCRLHKYSNLDPPL